MTKIIFFGTPYFVEPILKALYSSFDLVGVVSGVDSIQGRSKVLTPTPVKKWVKENTKKVSILTPGKLDEKFINQINSLDADLFVVAAFGKIIPQKVLDIPKYGALNIHPSLLPKHRGASPIQSAILAGEKTSGVTIIKMDDKMDHGPIIFQTRLDISGQDNFETLHNKFFHFIAGKLPQIINDFISGKIKPKIQDHQKATFCKILKKEDGYFNIEKPPSSDKLDKMARAFYPWPTAWTKWRNKIIKFYPDGYIQMEGKNKTTIKDFLRGYPGFPKDLLVNPN